MADRQSKGNGASKRMSNPRRKSRRVESWSRGEAAKATRRQIQAERERLNAELRREGAETPWEAAKNARRRRRAAAADHKTVRA